MLMMKLIDRYILRELASSFFIGLSLFTFILMMGKVLRLVELLIIKRVDLLTVLRLFLYILPYSLVVTIPLAVLLASLAAYSRLSSDGEVVALKATGWSLRRLMLPAAILGGLAYLATSFIALTVLPQSFHAYKDLAFRLAKQKATVGLQEGVFNSPSPGLILYIHQLQEEASTLRGIFLVDGRNPSAEQVVIASEGKVFSDSERGRLLLQLSQGSLQISPSDQPGRYRFLSFALYDLSVSIEGVAGPLERSKGNQEMTLRELKAEIQALKAQGENFRPFEVELYRKFAIPFACLIFALLGTPIGIKIKRGGRGASFALSFAFALLYYLLLVAGEALGNRGQLHPALAMWMPNFLLGTVGISLFRAEEKGLVPMWDVRGWMSEVGWGKARGKLRIQHPTPIKLRQRTGLVVLADPAWKLLVILVKGKELKFHVERKAASKLFDLERGRKVTVKYAEREGRRVAKTIVIPQRREALGVRRKG